MGTRRCPHCGHDLALGEATSLTAPEVAPSSLSAALASAIALGEPHDPFDGHGESLLRPAAGQSADDPSPSELLEAAHKSLHKAAEAGQRSAQEAGASAASPSHGAVAEENPMDQARHFVCTSCMTPVPTGHKFCGRCGAEVPEAVLKGEVRYFSEIQNPEKARLIVIRGEGLDGVGYHLHADQHIVGRRGQLEFPDDPFVSPKHANFFYRDHRLVVRDEGSLNGVYLRIRGSVEIAAGDTFLAGEQVFRLDPTPKANDSAETDGTFFYSSPKHPTAFRLSQILEGGATGMTVCARGTSLQIGRENGDLNFPGDAYMSGQHCTVADDNGRYTLTDHDSRNGTYIRIKSEAELGHGDYVFIGRKLLRVELTN
ncbi:MAG: FHA domain-containing protein [Polyangiaceae bacterium]|nr:FHA domain-containing protein [Polyangiaceae bacterium]